MKAWLAFGSFLNRHMPWFSLGFTALGILFPEVFAWIRPYGMYLFTIVTFQGALNNTFDQLANVVRHPRPVLEVLLVTAAAMPALTRVLGGLLFAESPDILAGAVLEFCVPVAVVSVVWTGLYKGNTALCLTILLVSTLLSPFLIPLAMQLLMGAIVEVDVPGIMGQMLIMVAIPAALGTSVNHFGGGRGKEQLSPVLAPLAKMVLFVIIAANSTQVADYFRHPDLLFVSTLLFIIAVSGVGFFVGLGLAVFDHRPAQDIVTMCITCGERNISAGAVIAASYFPPAAMLPVISGTIAQNIMVVAAGSALEHILGDEVKRG